MSRLDTPTTIRHQAADGAGEFVAEREGCRIGSLQYTRGEDTAITIERVFVAPEARGGAVARTLVDAAVALAMRDQARIIPRCRYARVLLRRHALIEPSVRPFG